MDHERDGVGKDNEVDLGDGMSCTSRDIQEWPEELDLREASLTKIGMCASVIAAVFAVLADSSRHVGVETASYTSRAVAHAHPRNRTVRPIPAPRS